MNDKNLAERLRNLRRKAGLTQEKLAEYLNVSTITISRWENGVDTPKTFKIKKLAEIFDCTESELLNDSENEEIKITMSYDWSKMKEAKIDMTRNEFTLCLGANGEIGLNGAMKFTGRETIDKFLAKVKEQVEIAFEAQVKRGVIRRRKL